MWPSHCASIQLNEWLEAAVTASGAKWAAGSVELLHITQPLYAVQLSDDVHVSAATNAVLAHIVASHLVRLVSTL